MSPPQDVEDPIHELASIDAIRQLTARYNRASDDGDFEAWLACFAPHGRFERSNDSRAFTGWEELRTLPGRIPVRARHITTDHIITVDGTRARQTCYLLYLDRDRHFRVHMFGVYDDVLVLLDGRWVFESRYLLIDENPAAGVAESDNDAADDNSKDGR